MDNSPVYDDEDYDVALDLIERGYPINVDVEQLAHFIYVKRTTGATDES